MNQPIIPPAHYLRNLKFRDIRQSLVDLLKNALEHGESQIYYHNLPSELFKELQDLGYQARPARRGSNDPRVSCISWGDDAKEPEPETPAAEVKSKFIGISHVKIGRSPSESEVMLKDGTLLDGVQAVSVDHNYFTDNNKDGYSTNPNPLITLKVSVV